MKKLLARLKENNISVSLDKTDLKIRFNEDKLPVEIIEELKKNKTAIIEYLNKIQEDQKEVLPINIVENKGNYALSSAQKRLWILSKFTAANTAYNIPGIYIFEGKLNIEALEQAFKTLINRHEILRTFFKEDLNGEVRQWVISAQETDFKINIKDVRNELGKGEKIKKLVEGQMQKIFDLETGPLLEATLIRENENKYVFVCNMHHIISDAWSLNLIIQELLLSYKGCLSGKSNLQMPLRIQYKDYTYWQKEQLTGEKLKAHRDYWLKQFSGECPVLELIGDKQRPKIKTYNGRIITTSLSEDAYKNFREMCTAQGATLYMGLIALVNTLLYKYTGNKDIIIGTTIAGREHPDLEDQIGFYVNTLALRTQFEGTDTFYELLQKVKQISLGAYEHQIYPFDDLINELNVRRDISRSPLFDVMVQLQNVDVNNVGASELEGVKVTPYHESDSFGSKYDLLFEFIENEELLTVGIQYNTDIYFEGSIQRMSSHLEKLVTEILTEPKFSLDQLDLLNRSEKQILLLDFNNTVKNYQCNKTLVELFEDQVKKSAGNIAIVNHNGEMDYKTLNEISNCFATYLNTEIGVNTGDLVGIKLERDEWMIASMIGVLKSGAAYVPIDPEYPEERVNYMLNDSNCKFVVDEKEIDKFKLKQSKYSGENVSNIIGKENLAYVIYTSGSTGQPKGVMIEHRNAVALINWSIDEFLNSNFETVLGLTSICFDLSIFEIFFTLLSGKKLRLLRGPLEIPENLEKENNVLLNTVPSVVGSLIAEKIDLTAVKVLNMAGEPIPERYLQGLDFESMEIRNLYGPSEDTTYSTIFRIEPDSPVTIGKPITNTSIYITNSNCQLVPIGVAGEICISGDGLSRGYLNKLSLTEEKFVNNPFKPGNKMYKTGDLGRWLNDGNIEFIGRKDNQVKIHGYRIELGDVENALAQFESIDQAVVLVRENNNEKQMIAFLVTKSADLDLTVLRKFLMVKLPVYMIPSRFVEVEKIPLTPNGKTDRNALFEYAGVGLENKTEFKQPQNETESKLVKIWCEVMEKQKISTQDSFFELGGHSLIAIRIVHQVKQIFGVQLDLMFFFQEPTIEALAIEIQNVLWMQQDNQADVKEKIVI
jgi:amino acid adenylation domain-containing protein